MKRRLRPGSHASAAFAITVLLAVAASVTTLVPHQTAQVADSLVHSQLDQLVPAGLFD
ncbi:hypothetical protein [Diaphorobacter sp. J5-51]|uniref:hypothetical protein n=1 Tax=unclassified Diaphorobacter TaxID=2649760 RepID=UPI0018FE29D7|nr:hypothetical protein [Diaphorobacter sp. J5-51]